VERYTRSSSNPNVADPQSALRIITIEQPFNNHNGGMLLFAPDGKLWIGMGDGGGAGDPDGNGQNSSALLGSLLRIDISGSPYSVPPDNPYFGQVNARPEIWAKGLRNPWRFSIDHESGLLYIGDVGQNREEEIDVVPSTASALNFGWNRTEGPECYNASSCNRSGFVEPAVTYDHSQGCSVTGGYTYRGHAIPEIVGRYFYADYCNGWLRSFRYVNGIAAEQRTWDVGSIGSVTSFGEDADGELYILTGGGKLLRIVKGS
jgi:glucose/arabinose dehydrogenase